MQIYGLKNCDSCRKALKTIPRAALVDVRKEGVPSGVLKAALAHFGEALVNTRSATWRGLSDTERSEDPLELIKTHPTVMKRPLIVDDDEMYLGWSTDVQAALNVA